MDYFDGVVRETIFAHLKKQALAADKGAAQGGPDLELYKWLLACS